MRQQSVALALPTAEPGCVDVIARLLAYAPAERPHAQELLAKHRWLTPTGHKPSAPLVRIDSSPSVLALSASAFGGGFSNGASSAPHASSLADVPLPLQAGGRPVLQCEFYDMRCLTMERAQLATLKLAKLFRPDLPVGDLEALNPPTG